MYSDVIDKVDKEPPFDLHAYLAPSVSTTTTSNAVTSSVMTTTASSTTTTTTVTSTVTTTTSATADKPKKEPSKPKLYVPISFCECSVLLPDRTTYTIQPSTEAERNLFRLQVQ